MRGKTCESDAVCGQGLTCIAGVCEEAGDAGSSADAGCELAPLPPLCPVAGQTFCTGGCVPQDITHCTESCVECPGGSTARCSGNACTYACGGDAGICGASPYCQTLCPGWHDQLAAGIPGGKLAASDTVTQFGDMDTVNPQTNFLGVGIRADGGFALYTAQSGEPWLFSSMPVPLEALDTNATYKWAWAAGRDRVYYRSNGVWSCYPAPPTRGNLTAIRYRVVGSTGTLFATDDQGALWKTIDGTTTPSQWRNFVQVSPSRPFRDVAVSPSGGLGLAVGDNLLVASDDAQTASAWLNELATLPSTYVAYDLYAAQRENNANVYAVSGRARRCASCAWEGILLVTRKKGASWDNFAPAGMPTVHRFDLRLGGATPDVWMAGDRQSVARCLIGADGGVASCPTQTLDGGTGALRALTSGCERCAIVGGEGGILRVTTTGG